MFKLAADPNRWINLTAPLSASSALKPVCNRLHEIQEVEKHRKS